MKGQRQRLEIIRTPERISELLQYLNDKEYIAVDTETTGTIKGSTVIGMSFCAEPGVASYVIFHEWKNDGLIGLDTVRHARELCLALKGKSLIGHNFTFDADMIETNFKVRLIDDLHTDTMLLAHLLNENRRVGLKELAKTETIEGLLSDKADSEQIKMRASAIANGATLTKDKYELYKADADLIAEYGAKDALLTYMLFTTMVPQLFEQGLDKFFYEDETMPLLKTAGYELNTVGNAVDTKALTSLRMTLLAECALAKDFIYREIQPYIQDLYPGTNKKTTFNISSSKQMSWLLFEKLQLEFNTLTKGGKALARRLGKVPYSRGDKNRFRDEVNGLHEATKTVKPFWHYTACDKETLKKYSQKYKWIEKLLEYQKKTKLLTTYVKGIEQRTTYGIIRPSFIQIGTTSGRFSSRNPNWQNLPRDDKRIKACIIARPGCVFVGADYSQLEPRVFAFFSKDERLLSAFRGTDDFYSVIGMEVYNKTDCLPVKDGSPDAFGIKYKKLRDLSKVIALASTYGATAWQLMKTTGKNEVDTQADMDSYFEKFPGVATMMTESHEMAKKHGYVTTHFGRPRRIPEAKLIDKEYPGMPHSDLPYEARSLLNLAVNHRIQGTGASIINRAMIRLCQDLKKANINGKIVSQVHDSLIVECPEADADLVATIMQDCMENTTVLPGIKLEAVPKIGRTFADV